MSLDHVDEDALAVTLMEGRQGDPFGYLGPHADEEGWRLRTFQPGALGVSALDRATGEVLRVLSPVGASGLFTGVLDQRIPYRLRIAWPDAEQDIEDPYRFGEVLGALDLHLFSQGAHFEIGRRFGAQPMAMEGVSGVAFSVWAPNARRVSVIGDFNIWDGRRHPMRLRYEAGVWEMFIPGLGPGARYKFEILSADGAVLQKADPVARATEPPPATASVVAAPPDYGWTDQDWMRARLGATDPQRPISIYEVHPASWVRPAAAPEGTLDWDGLAERLAPYVADMGFTHVELMPIMEHPFGGSWGYQPLSQFAPTARFGPPEGLARFVDACHRLNIGVILDWVPAHFPTDAHGLERFDGTALYEYADPKEGFHQDWNSLIYNFGRHEVQGFLIASALFWLDVFHVDALRVDAVASMLYRDYSRKAGEWIPNRYGGRENLEAVEFIKRLNQAVLERASGAMMIAEESTAWPGVSSPVQDGGLGFTYKWNMGWMHDTLAYVELDPVYRAWRHGQMTFGMVYAYSERFILPLSHDEVVYGKGSMIGKMPGDPWRKHATLRAYFAFMFAHPGKKLLFMGAEIAQAREWNHDGEIDWPSLDRPEAVAVQRLVRDLNRLYREEPALHQTDSDPEGFEWVVGDDSANSVFAFLRRPKAGGPPVLFAVNFTPVPRIDYRIGAPEGASWRLVLNTDAEIYGGGNVGMDERVQSETTPAHGRGSSVRLALPPLGAVFYKRVE